MNTFSEVQRFKIKWAWMGMIALNGLFIYAIIKQVVFGESFGTKPAPNWVLILCEMVCLLLLLFILSDAYIREYNSLYEYGGWGIRYGSPKTGNAVNTSDSCNMGLQLQFKNGKLLLIGTKNPDAIKIILDEVIASGKINRHI